MGGENICFLIDDDLDDQEVFAMAIGEVDTSMQVFFARDGIEALEKLVGQKTFIPDYIFIDLNMPRMGGKECLIEIKKISHLNHIPLVIYSTFSNEQYELELLKLGATEYIVKPKRISTLVQRLHDFFKTH
jgi:CheY-like chemotaxis protein